MALQGTIDTFELTEVVRLLAAGSKTGVLRLDGSRGSGGVWVKDGQVTAVVVDQAPHADSYAEAMFELLRFDDGSFTFEPKAEHDAPGDPAEVEGVLEQAEAQLAEWREIERVVPSTRATVTLRPELKRADVVLDKDRWRLVAAIGGGVTVATVGERLGMGELPISRAVKDLVELGVVELHEGPAPTPEPEPVAAPVERPAEPAPLADPEPLPSVAETDPFEPIVVEPDAVPEVVEPVVLDDPSPARAQLDEFAVGFGLADPPPMAPVNGNGNGNGDGNGHDTAFDGFGLDGANGSDGLFGTDPLADIPGLPDLDLDGSRRAEEPVFDEPVAPPAPLLGAGNDAAEVARQLSNLSPAAARAVATAAKATTEEEREAALAAVNQEGEEPIDRELLLRFLASVKA